MMIAEEQTVEEKTRHLCELVRQGRFTDARQLADDCWEIRSDFNNIEEHDLLRIHTLNWEVYEALGEYKKAAERLRYDQVVDQCAKKIREANAHPRAFVHGEFLDTVVDPPLRQQRYRLWRQRTMVIMADAIASEPHFAHHPRQLLDDAENFINNCLLPAGFKCNGTRCRHQYFSAILYHAAEEFDKAARACQESRSFCDERLKERLASHSADAETERAFANYCLAKLQVKLGEIKFDQGYLQQAQDHLGCAIVLLRTTQDHFLAARAQLRACMIERADQDLSKERWALLDRVSACRRELTNHPFLDVHAGIEEVTTEVYLMSQQIPRVRPSTNLPDDYKQARESIEAHIEAATLLGTPGVALHFHALLVKARIEIRMGQPEEARITVDKALDLYRTFPRQRPPSALHAEASFVRGKSYFSQAQYRNALNCFQEAFAHRHGSRLFKSFCQLRILHSHLNQQQFGLAQEALDECKQLGRNLESANFSKRLEELERRFKDAHVLIIEFRPPFRLQERIGELERRYVLFLAAQINREVHELLLPGYWRQLKQKGLVGKKRQIEILLKRHFPDAHREALRVSSRSRPTPGRAPTTIKRRSDVAS